MTARSGFAAVVTLLGAAWLATASALAQTTIVNENFDSYADTAAMELVWTADLGQGDQPTTGPKGLIVPGSAATAPYDNPPGIQGKGVNILSAINEYNGPNKGQLTNLVPTATQAIRLTADIFDKGEFHRASVGIRNDTVNRGSFGLNGTNFVEIGYYNTRDPNTNPNLPADPPPAETLNVTGYGYRINTLFNTDSLAGSGLQRQPNWQNFDLDPILDRPDEEEGAAPNNFANVADIGAGWHRFTVEIGTFYHKVTLDLFRDGMHNTDNVEGVGYPGVDAEVVWMVAPHNDAVEPNPFDPYTSLRFGSPSGIANTTEAVVDNILLQLVSPTVGLGADANGNATVEGSDFLTWQRHLGVLGQAGDYNRDGFINDADFAAWKTTYGGAPVAAAAGVVPEPAAAALALLGLGMLAARRRAS
jgi:hypothetical protein